MKRGEEGGGDFELRIWNLRPSKFAIRNSQFEIFHLRMLMTQFNPELLDHGVHLVFQVEFLLLKIDFFEAVLIRNVVPVLDLRKLTFVFLVFLDQTAKLWIRGHQAFLDLLILHHRVPPMEWKFLQSEPTV